MIEHGTHIKFVPGRPKPKTKVWSILNNYGDGELGTVQWFSRWRKYSFFPADNTVYEEVCLREIADFCQRKTTEHKAAWTSPPSTSPSSHPPT